MSRKMLLNLLFFLVGGAAVSFLLSAAAEGRVSIQGWLGGTILLVLAVAGLWLGWRVSGSPPSLLIAAAIAFLIRLVAGIALSIALPVWGHESEVSQAGYLFFDAYTRDRQAWQLAQSGASLFSAFSNEFSGDQYGGMLAVSALVYRLFSPDVHRSYLIIILTAFASAAAVPFFYEAVRKYFGQTIAITAAWIYVAYPESVLLGAAQMRDPILIALAGVAFWLVSRWQDAPRRVTVGLILVLAVTAAFSYLVALPLAGILFLWWWLEYSGRVREARIRTAVWVLVGLGATAVMLVMGAWLKESALWDARLTETGSGKIQALFQSLPDVLELPFLVVYGLLQPVLPAAIFDPSTPLWTGITTFRSLGWYLMLPLLGYVPLGLRHTPKGLSRSLVFWAFLIVLGWSLLSSFRAGGDLWDNPRYRTLLLPWLAMLAAWAFHSARQYRDVWFTRLVFCEGIFLAVFSLWYANRSFRLELPFSFLQAVAATVILCAVVLLAGFWVDRLRILKKRSP